MTVFAALEKESFWEFPGGLVVGIWHVHGCGLDLILGLVTEIPLHASAKEKKKNPLPDYNTTMLAKISTKRR